MKQIDSIQILRAVAALLVVFSHAQNDALVEAMKTGVGFVRLMILPWASGVDLFFVISGFIMVYASQSLFAKQGAGGLFISRRVIRIVPLYWLVTAIALVILAYVAWAKKIAFPSVLEIASSLSFIPFARPSDGDPRPIVALGWTLNYEMFFYVVFALFVRFRRDIAVPAVVASLGLFVGLGVIFHPKATVLAYWSDPIVLEFALGMLTALVWQSGLRINQTLAWLLVMIGIAVLALDLDGMTKVGPTASDPSGFSRLIGCGLPMALIFAAIVLTERGLKTQSRLAAAFALLGDASYALYLFHPLVIIFARKAYLALHLAETIGFWPLIAVDLPMAALAALIIHVTVEKPVTHALQAWLHTRAPQPK